MSNEIRLRTFFKFSLALLLALALWSAWAASPAYAQGPDYYVDADAAGGTGTGLDWTNAFTTVQAALSAAANGDEIWVATGVYTPGLSQSDTFTLTSGIALYGGFAGTETVRTERDWETNVTVLSGDIDGDDTTDANGVVTDTANISGTNNRHVIWADGVNGDPITATTVLDGFTITAGQASSGGDYQSRAGGFYCDGAGSECSPSLSHIIFSGNVALLGGALYNGCTSSGVANMSLSDVTFFANSATSGGAMYNEGDDNSDCSPTLTNVIFSSNTASGTGGAFSNESERGTGNPGLNDVTFIGNSANYGGAIYNYNWYDGASSPSLVNVSFYSNTATTACGALYNETGDGGESSPSLENVIFSGNSTSGQGGAVCNWAWYGGTVSPDLVNVTFANNTAGTGGALHNDGSDGGTSSPSLTNVILWGNTATVSGTQIYNADAAPVISYTLIQSDTNAIVNTGASTVTFGSNILTDDPLFVNVAGGDAITGTLDDDLRLSAFSPAIDAGDNNAVSTGTDLDGNPRFFDDIDVDDTGNGTVPIVDMGAYERQSHSLDAHAPVAADDAYTTTQDAVLTVAAPGVLANDTDADGDPLTATLDSGPSNGALNLNLDGSFTYTPTAGFSGVDTFTYRASDGIDDSNIATVTIAVGSVPTYTLTVNVVGNGSVTPDPVGTLLLPTGWLYEQGTVVTLTATPDADSEFTGWSGALSGTASPVTLTMDSDKTITATFDLLPVVPTYTLTVAVDGTGSGTITPTVGAHVYDQGEVITLTATPDSGSYFGGWTGDLVSADNPTTIVMDADRTITATFTTMPPVTYTLTVHTVGNGSVEPAGGTYISGTVLNLSATPDPGWQFDGWTGDLVGATTPISLTMDGDKVITATFSAEGFSIYLPLVAKDLPGFK